MARIERNLTDRILRQLNKMRETRAVKIHSGAMQGAGLPDVWVCHRGALVLLEVKRDEGSTRLTRLQRAEMHLWRQAGAVATVVSSVEGAIAAVLSAVDAVNYPEHEVDR